MTVSLGVSMAKHSQQIPIERTTKVKHFLGLLGESSVFIADFEPLTPQTQDVN